MNVLFISSSFLQRHCRLKHAGVINIETLDRAATGDRHMAPIYKPLVNGALNDQSNNSNNTTNNNNSNSISSSNNPNGQYSLTLKALQQQNNSNNQNNNVLSSDNSHQHQQQQQQPKLSITSPKTEVNHSLLHSPLAGNTGGSPSQDLQAAAVAYLAAAYKAAAAQNGNSNATSAAMADITSMAEQLLLQQQLQKNDQIEITRVSSSSTSKNNQNLGLLNGQSTVSNSNLAQLLETSVQAGTPSSVAASHQNAKSKQQKCPLCTYICDSKSQMNYHISLHKPTQYECHLCTFVCAKKQHLSSHMRTVHQILPQQQQQAFSGASGVLNMDFSMALKMAAATKSQQVSLSDPK